MCRRRLEPTDHFKALVSHYLFEPCFTRPGKGHDKANVEARVHPVFRAAE
jgi:hypothetical protein